MEETHRPEYIHLKKAPCRNKALYDCLCEKFIRVLTIYVNKFISLLSSILLALCTLFCPVHKAALPLLI